MTEPRVARLRARLAQDGLDGFLVTGRSSVRWLSGYAGTNGYVLLAPGVDRFLTDFRYAEGVASMRQLWAVEIVEHDLVGEVADGLDLLCGDARRIGFESAVMPHAAWARLDEAARRTGRELVPTVGLVESLRAVKDPDELARIRRGAELTDELYGWLVEEGLAGRRERDVARGMARRLAEQGAEGPSFPPIVTAGSGGATPHAVPRDEPIERGTLVIVDVGAVVDGYCSDCTRTFATGTTDDAMKEVYEVVLRAQEAALALVRPGTACADVHEAARDVIEGAGFGAYFNHGTGHGVGVDLQELPVLRAGRHGVLVAGNVVTVEPGVYLPDRFGVRIEDLVVVTDDGHEVLTRYTKSLVDAG